MDQKMPLSAELSEKLTHLEEINKALRMGEIDTLLQEFEHLLERARRLEEENAKLKSEQIALASQWQSFFDSISDAVFILSPDHEIINATKASQETFGMPVKDMIGKKCCVVVHGSDAPIKDCPLLRLRHTYKRESIEMQFQSRWYHVSVEPILDAKGNLLRVVHIVRDVTERERLQRERESLQEQLYQAQKLESVGRLAAGVAHDFNNMLGIMMGFAELLLREFPKGDKRSEKLEKILEAGKRGAHIIKQLLAFSRKQTLEPKVLDLNELVRNLVKMLGRLIGEDIELRLNLQDPLPMVYVDPVQMEQVIINMAVNARDAMPRGGTLTIVTQGVTLDEYYAKSHPGVAQGEYVLLSMTDTGCGMDKETLSRIFEPFFTTKEMGKGTGLGLSTVYGIVKQHGGNIWAYSEVGKGSTFKIYLPVVAGEAKTEKGPETYFGLGGAGEKVLVVEDDPILRQLCLDALSEMGFHVRATGDPHEALGLRAAFQPDLLITDVVMPKMNGVELFGSMKETLPELKVLFMSGYPEDTIAHHGLLPSEYPFIQKPFSVKVFISKVAEIVRKTIS